MSTLVITRAQRRGIVGAATFLLLSAFLAVVLLGGSELASSEDSELPTDELALFDGGSTTLAGLTDGPLVINFWASWCPACVAELPEIQAVATRFGDDVTVVGIANTDERGPALALANDVGLTYTLADDPTGELFRKLDLFAMPSTLFVTADGRIHEVFGGQLDEEALVSRIESLLEAS